KRATRQLISNIATKLFVDRGFNHVSVDEVAAAADISKMTVFNYFPRKEDLFFDRNDDVQRLIRNALENRGRSSPIAALRTLTRGMVEQGHPITKTDRIVVRYWKVVANSPALRARALEQLEELERELGGWIAASVDAAHEDPLARMISGTILRAWRIALAETLRPRPSATFLQLLDHGFGGARAIARGTPYA
ncbi:MAG TPA: TetR/AcrR family transcriptional regulator, partial [Polyangiales bacterium]